MIISIIDENKIKKIFRIKSTITRVGRGPENDIVIQDRKISRNHLQLLKDKNTLKIKDLNTTNGTYINNIKIKPGIFYDVKHVDKIKIGSNIISVLSTIPDKKTKNKLVVPLAVSLSVVVLTAIILTVIFTNNDRNTNQDKISTSTEIIETTSGPGVEVEESTVEVIEGIPTDITSIIEDMLPSVVDISIIDSYGGRYNGSGVVHNEEGYIITNYHVIENSKDISIKTYEENTLKAEFINYRKDIDIALLKVENQNLEVPIFGKSSELKIGQDVVAIGSPYGFSSTVTKGIISAIRDLEDGHINISDSIQHDADINPGNSGGPLIDSNGKVIGINFSIFSPDQSSSGLSFAIPIDIVLEEIPILMKTELIEETEEDTIIETYDENYIFLDKIYKILGEYEKAINHMNYYYENSDFSNLNELIDFEKSFLNKLGEINSDLQNIGVPSRYKNVHTHMIGLANNMYSYIEQEIDYLEKNNMDAADNMIDQFNNTYSELVTYYNNL